MFTAGFLQSPKEHAFAPLYSSGTGRLGPPWELRPRGRQDTARLRPLPSGTDVFHPFLVNSRGHWSLETLQAPGHTDLLPGRPSSSELSPAHTRCAGGRTLLLSVIRGCAVALDGRGLLVSKGAMPSPYTEVRSCSLAFADSGGFMEGGLGPCEAAPDHRRDHRHDSSQEVRGKCRHMPVRSGRRGLCSPC